MVRPVARQRFDVFVRLLLAVSWMTSVCDSDASASKTDLEAAIRAAYVDTGAVGAKVAMVGGHEVEFLEAGPADGRAVVFCHGAAFSAHTWQFVGVLDALADKGFRAIAVNLPGYGRTERAALTGTTRDGFLGDFVAVLGLGRVAVVAASMGGTFGLPYALHGDVAGYLSAAGLIAGLAGGVDVPTLFVYGDEDPRLGTDAKYHALFRNSDLVVFDNAPHPCYLRDLDAARLFTDLVLAFVGASDGPVVDGHPTVRAQW